MYLKKFSKKKKLFINKITKFLKKNKKSSLFVESNSDFFRSLNIFVGKIIGNRDGYGFLRIDSLEKDVWVSVNQMKKCIHGDIVLSFIKLDKNKKNRLQAVIFFILKKNNSLIVGRCSIKHNNLLYFIPNDDRYSFKIRIKKYSIEKKIISNRTIISVRLIKRPKNNLEAVGEIVEVFGEKKSTDLSIEISLKTHSIPFLWSKKIFLELKKICKNISKKKYSNRVDLRSIPFVTIDDESSYDFDDAIFCSKLEKNCWKVLVAISDVSHYVLPGTEIDKEAKNRSNSIYFPSKVIPMLPEKLSIDICSLNPKEDRLVLVCEIFLSDLGEIIKFNHFEAVIKSFCRLNYSEVYQFWKKEDSFFSKKKKYKKIIDELNNLQELYFFLKNSKFFKNKIMFTTYDPKFILGENSKLIDICIKNKNCVHKLVEFCMILANTVSAIFVKRNKEPALFREHDIPSLEKMNYLRLVLLNRFNIVIPKGNNSSLLNYKNIIEKISNNSDRILIEMILLRTMKPAVYGIRNIGHFGLSLDSYVHFTSPIRRYSDLLLHRSIKHLLRRNKKNGFSSFLEGSFHYSKEEIKKLGNICSTNEKRSEESVREVIDWMKCDFMKSKINNSYMGKIINVTRYGVLVRLEKFFIDIFLHISSFKKDKYIFDVKKIKLIGKNNKLEYSLGDFVSIKITAVFLESGKIEAILEK
ncbi:ribonuclease R [Buchnera aphidicola]|uniref:ribonuclease R n=1 Tax=Buchnera aphidicola TaxID=9 RepID=UPI0034638789